jgi:Tat protein secretion system quality control protein TatD with DNase activity
MLDRFGVRRAIVHWYSRPRDAIDAIIARDCSFTFGVETLHSTTIQTLAQLAPPVRILTETDGPQGLYWLTGEVADLERKWLSKLTFITVAQMVNVSSLCGLRV